MIAAITAPTSAKLATNGIRHPHVSRKASSRLVRAVMVNDEANRPMFTPKAGSDPKRPRVRTPACS